MKANQDKTVSMSTASKPDQQPVIPTQSVCNKMKDVSVKKAASMKLTKTGTYKGHK